MKYLTVASTAARNSLASRGALVASASAATLRLFILFAIYIAVFAQTGGSVQGVSLHAAAWSIGSYFILLSLNARRIARDLSFDVQHGTIEVRCAKPASYLGWVAADRIGRGLPDFLLFLTIGTALAWWMVGPPPAGALLPWSVGVLALAAGGTVTTLLLYTLVGLTALWIETSDPVFWIVDKAILILGGSFVPVALFPEWLRAVADYSPLGAPMYVTRAFSPGFDASWPTFAGLQLAWILALACAVWWTWRSASRRLSVNGG